MSVEVIVVNKDDFQYIASKMMPEALIYIDIFNLRCSLFSIIGHLKIYKKAVSCVVTNITVKQQRVPEIKNSVQESKYFSHLCLIVLLPQQDCFLYDLCNTQY